MLDNTWGVRDLEGKEWKFTYDGSIHTQRRNGNRYVYADSEYSTEMVSPKLEYGEMEKLQQVVRCLRSHGGKSIPPVECMFMWMPPIIHHEV